MENNIGRGDQESPEFDFTPPERLEDLTPKLANDLYDILTKWGNEYTDEPVRVYRFKYEGQRIPSALRMSAPVNPDPKALARLIVYKNMYHMHGSHVIHNTNGERILWDRDLTVQETIDLIGEIDQMGKTAGLIDAQGRRISLSDHVRIKP